MRLSRTQFTACGQIDSLIGGFVLILQGILTFFTGTGGAILSLSILGLMSATLRWLGAIIMIVIGILVLLLVWEWLIEKVGFRITNDVLLGVIIFILGLLAGSAAGLLIMVGGILYIIGGY